MLRIARECAELKHPKPQFIMPSTPGVKTGVGVLLLHRDEQCVIRVLLGLRKGSHGANMWSLPGGYLEQFETFEQAALRELKEECGIEQAQLRVCGIVPFVSNNILRADGVHTTSVFVECWTQAAGGIAAGDPPVARLLEPDKCHRWEWVPWRELNLRREPLFPALKQLICGFVPVAPGDVDGDGQISQALPAFITGNSGGCSAMPVFDATAAAAWRNRRVVYAALMMAFGSGLHEIYRAGWGGSAVWYTGVLFVLHAMFVLGSPLPAPLPELNSRDIYPPLRSPPRSQTRAPLRVVVTGGCGSLGAAIVRQLACEHHFSVTVLDLALPLPHRRVNCDSGDNSVEYRVVDLAAAPDALLQSAMEGAAAVVHTAGIVRLCADPGTLHNVHVVATQRVLRAARLSGVRCFVHTSSTGCWHDPTSWGDMFCVGERSARARQLLYRDRRAAAEGRVGSHPHYYGATKRRAETIVLAANDTGDAPSGAHESVSDTSGGIPGAFLVAALRLPGVYAHDDPLIVMPLLSGAYRAVPATPETTIDFVYVENAAHAHCCALRTLLAAKRLQQGSSGASRSEHDSVDAVECARAASGKAYHITNNDPQRTIKMWDTMLSICRPGRPPLFCIPKVVLWPVAAVLEVTFALLAGRVPFPRASVWNLTLSSLDFSTTSATFATEAAVAIGYTPRYDNVASFRHIKQRLDKEEVTHT